MLRLQKKIRLQKKPIGENSPLHINSQLLDFAPEQTKYFSYANKTTFNCYCSDLVDSSEL